MFPFDDVIMHYERGMSILQRLFAVINHCYRNLCTMAIMTNDCRMPHSCTRIDYGNNGRNHHTRSMMDRAISHQNNASILQYSSCVCGMILISHIEYAYIRVSPVFLNHIFMSTTHSIFCAYTSYFRPVDVLHVFYSSHWCLYHWLHLSYCDILNESDTYILPGAALCL